MKQLEDVKMINYYDEYLALTSESEIAINGSNVDNSDASSEEELTGANKSLKFDDDLVMEQEMNVRDAAVEEFRRYKEAKTYSNDIEILFRGKVSII